MRSAREGGEQGSERLAAAGFTLIEILTVIAIIVVLLGLLTVAVVKVTTPTRERRTSSTITKLKAALELYKAKFGEYPSDLNGASKTWPDPYDNAGVELDCWFIRHVSATPLGGEELDPADRSYAFDAWHQRIRYRKPGPDSYLVWSVGEDGVDQIGNGTSTRAGDDISSVGVE